MSEDPGTSLHELVLSYLDDPEIRLAPDDPASEVSLNTWGYSFAAGSVDVGSVVSALKFVAAELRARATSTHGTFYAWFDAQAGQLRCSVSSAPPDRLPFGGVHHLVDDPIEIVATAAVDRSPGVLLREELHEDSGAETLDRIPNKSFPVWAVELSA